MTTTTTTSRVVDPAGPAAERAAGPVASTPAAAPGRAVEGVAAAPPGPPAAGQVVVDRVMAALEGQPLNAKQAQSPKARRNFDEAVVRLVDHLEQDGGTWRERWNRMEQRSMGAESWWASVLPPGGMPAYNAYLPMALGQLVRHDIVRPSHDWMHRWKLNFLGPLVGWRDPDAAAQLAAQLESLRLSPAVVQGGTWMLGSICANTGWGPRDITGTEIVRVRELRKTAGLTEGRSAGTMWAALRELGWLGDVPPIMPIPKRREPPKTPEQLVDYYKITSPQREVLIEYLTTRSPAMDYNTLSNLACHIAGNFWADIARHHPDLPGFALDPVHVKAWRERLGTRADGRERRHMLATLFAVRSFYLDMAQWSLSDPYWAQWVARCPIGKGDIKANLKQRRKVIARHQQRTRELAPLLPALIAQAEKENRETRAALETASALGSGGK